VYERATRLFVRLPFNEGRTGSGARENGATL
jgi:hypothetical protein